MNELAYVTVEEAEALPGLRVAFTQHFPGPWGVAVRGILEYKQLAFVPVIQEAGGDNADLLRWTGQTSAPVAVYEDEKPKVTWSEVILLAERLAPGRPLIPADAAARAEMFGLCHELAAEDGLGWSLRTMMFEARKNTPTPSNAVMIRKYDNRVGYRHAIARADAVLDMLGGRLEAQKARGRRYLMGEAVTAADFYLTGFSHLLRSFPPHLCEMPEMYRTLSDMVLPHLKPIPEIIFEHRDHMLATHVRCPFKF
jgi:glutathione S-transferase